MLTSYGRLLQRCKPAGLKHAFNCLSTSQTRLSNTTPVNDDSKLFLHRFIPFSEYVERQKQLVSLVNEHLEKEKSSSLDKGSLIVISGANRLFVADTTIPTVHFKQNSDFLYFTGLNTKEAANCCLVLLAQKDSFESYLFFPFLTKKHFIWEGAGLKGEFYSDHITSVSSNQKNILKLPEFLKKHCDRNVFMSRAGLDLKPPAIAGLKTTPKAALENPLKDVKTIKLSPLIDKLRLTKSPAEIDCMRRTCAIGGKAMTSTIKWTQSQVLKNRDHLGLDGVLESQIAAKFEFESRSSGACKPSYPPVIAGDDRATILHYAAQDKPVRIDEWILTDAGCEDIEGYASDITRSWPLVGEGNTSKFRLTKEIYDALSETQRDLVKFVEENMFNISLNDLYFAMNHALSKVLTYFGIIKKEVDENEARVLADRFCPHHVSHYLGLDVHDCPLIDRNRRLVKGICFTIEPGLYFHRDDPDVPKEFQGMGLRVEDDFVITHEGVLENLTYKCPHTSLDLST